jgi:hypothetical protein
MFLNMIFKELMDIRNYLIHAYFGDFSFYTCCKTSVLLLERGEIQYTYMKHALLTQIQKKQV